LLQAWSTLVLQALLFLVYAIWDGCLHLIGFSMVIETINN